MAASIHSESKRRSRSAGTGGLVAQRVLGKGPCSNLRPVSPTHIYFDVPGINLPGNQPERLGKRRNVVQHSPEMAGASRHDEEVPQLVETEDSGHQVGTF